MSFSVWLRFVALVLPLLAVLNGCVPSGRGELEEEREPHFLAGKNAVNGRDFRGAIEEFEKALQVNPQSAAAHFELGWLYEEKESDAAAAIYHYERFLKLRPSSKDAEVIRQRIMNCKQDLAKTVLPLPITPGLSRQIEQLSDEVKRLREENDKWKAYFASRPVGATNPVDLAPLRAPSVNQSSPIAPGQHGGTQGSEPRVSTPARTHTVKAGETPSSIARRYGVRPDALMAANPGLDPRRMRVGQTLNIP